MPTKKVYDFLVNPARIRKFLLIIVCLASAGLFALLVQAGVFIHSSLAAMEQQMQAQDQRDVPSSVVWVGYDYNTSLNRNAAQTAVKNLPVRDFVVPSGIVMRMIDPTTGKLAMETCTHRVQELFIQGTEPLEDCSEYYHSMPPDYFTNREVRLRALTPDNIVETPPTYGNSELQRFQEQPAYLALTPKAVPFVFTNENLTQSERQEEKNHD